MKTPHKHAATIKAWADGAEIECRQTERGIGMNACPNCGLVKGLHASILPGCTCFPRPQDTVPGPTPDWKAEYLKTADLHCITLDELREAQADLKEARHANEKFIARIVGLQDEIRNLTGEE